MFEMPENFQEMLSKAQEMQSKLAQIKEEAEQKEVETSAGGGMVTVSVNGAQKLTKLTIDPSVVDPNDIEMLQDLVLAAVNEGVRKSRELVSEEIKKLTGGLPIPGL